MPILILAPAGVTCEGYVNGIIIAMYGPNMAALTN